MRIVRESIGKIDKIWGKQKIKETKYRPLKYLIHTRVDEKILLYNVVTGELVVLNEEESERFEGQWPRNHSSIMDEMIEEHFLVPEDYDEKNEVLKLRRIYSLVGKQKGIVNYVILPTTYCNARCFYCYESSYSHIHMTENTAGKLVDFIAGNNEGNPVRITWFGGEPLLGENIITQVCDNLRKRNVKFHSQMISNGYLFMKEIVNKARDVWNLTYVQITLDGTEDVYNQIKAYVNARDNPFEKVMDNIELLLQEEINVHIRLNIGLHNVSDMEDLITILLERFSGYKTLQIYAQKLFENEGFKPVSNSGNDISYLAEKVVEFEKRIEMEGKYNFNKMLPKLSKNRCMADNDRSLLVYPDGRLFKCEHVDEKDCIGNLDEGIIRPDLVQNWKKTSEFSLCERCPLVPDCVILDGCSDLDECQEVLRDRKIETFKKEMRELYSKCWQ